MGSGNAVETLERKLVEHCSPAIAGLKPANMFSVRLKCAECSGDSACASLSFVAFLSALACCRVKLEGEGLRLGVLAFREKSVLLLVYRSVLLAKALGEPRAAAFLASLGYEAHDVPACVELLSRRVCRADRLSGEERTCAFPHEVGLFLGYPFEDVMGFIVNEGQGAVASGCWRVYSRERDAAECFCRYKECTRECEMRYEAGMAIEELASLGKLEAMRQAA